jgi:hypothetical protein
MAMRRPAVTAGPPDFHPTYSAHAKPLKPQGEKNAYRND